MNTKHTPTPWFTKDDPTVYSNKEGVIARTAIGLISEKRNKDNAHFIVHAVNNYQALLEGVKLGKDKLIDILHGEYKKEDIVISIARLDLILQQITGEIKS